MNSRFVIINIGEVFVYNFFFRNSFSLWEFIGDNLGKVMDGVVSNEPKIREEFKGKID